MPAEEGSQPGTDHTGDEVLPATSLGSSPVCSIIRPQLWVHWTITLLCLGAWGGMMYLGDLAEQTDFGLRDILGLRSGRVPGFFSTIMLLWAGQLSLLIYWYRRKSRNDFDGRYRMWLWIGGMLQFFLVVSATGAHRPFAQHVQRVWPMDIPMYGLLAWLVPVATLGLAMYRMLRIELKRHRSGRFLLNVSGTAAMIAAAALIVGPLLPDRIRDLAQVGSATLANLTLATSLLMHARYVVHISNEVPRRRERPAQRVWMAIRHVAAHLPGASRLTSALPRLRFARPKIPRLSLPKLTLSKLTLPQLSLRAVRRPGLKASKDSQQKSKPDPATGQKTDRTDSAATESGAVTGSARKKSRKSPSGSTGTKSKQGRTEARGARTSAVDRSQKPDGKPARKQNRRVDSAEAPKGPRQGPSRSLDDLLKEHGSIEEIDAETLRGLSKKQRRRLRKKQRELQRAGK